MWGVGAGWGFVRVALGTFDTTHVPYVCACLSSDVRAWIDASV